MQTFPAGLTVKITLPFIDMNGDPVTPTGLSYLVRDHDDEIIRAPEILTFDPADTEIEIPVVAALNHLATGTVIGARTVALAITTLDGVHQQEATYLVRAYQRLVPPTNSFQTDAGAQVFAADIPGLIGFTTAEASARQAALIEAHARITRLRLQSTPYEGCHNTEIAPDAWAAMDAATFRAFLPSFRKALFRAQIQEANHILEPNPIRDKRRAGVLSETIGESSMMFRSGKPVEGLMSSEALAEISAYVVRRATIGRA